MSITQEELEIFEGHNQATSEAFEQWAKEHTYYCHFTPMQIVNGIDKTLFECKHCGHTVDVDGIHVEV